MKFSSAVAILAASGAASASIMERQVQTIIGVVNGINTEIGNLDTAVKGFSGDPSPLLAASKKTLDAVTKGVETVKGASSITLTDSVQIQGQVQNLQSSIESVVSDLLAKKSELVAAGQGQAVYKNLEDQMTGAKGLAAAISSKVPPEVKTLADSLSAGIISALQKGIDGFKDAPGGGSAQSAGSTEPTSSSGSMAGMAGMPGMSGSSSTSGSSTSGTSTSGGSAAGVGGTGASAAHPAGQTNSALPKPATYTGAAPRSVAGSFAVVVAAIVALAL